MLSKYCVNCGKKNNRFADKCYHCNKPINKTIEESLLLIAIHIILLFFTFGIGNLLFYLFCNWKIYTTNQNKMSYSNSSNSNKQNDYYIDENGNSPTSLLFEEYRDIFKKHLELRNKINIKYSIAINQPNIFNKHTEECKKLCLEDIQLAPKMREYDIKNAKLYNPKGTPLDCQFESCSIFAKLCEKQGMLKDAILICLLSIKMGYILDSSKGGMHGRLARLIKKYNKENETNFQYDYDNNILFDDKTGEVIKE